MLTKALTQLAPEILRDPARLVRAGAERAFSEAALALEISRVALGGKEEPSGSPDAGDRRFNDPAWRETPWLRGVLGSYLLRGRWWQQQLEASRLEGAARRKARFALDMIPRWRMPASAMGVSGCRLQR